jgi:hypothetical protein
MNHSHNAIIKGNIFRKVYLFGYSPYWYGRKDKTFYETTELVSEEVIWEGYLDMPVLKNEECIYIQELQATVRITGCLRTTDNKFIYTTSHVIETIEDEITEKSKSKAEELQKKHIEELEQVKLPEEKLNDEKHIPWYKRLFEK